jgi:hypothetical protein
MLAKLYRFGYEATVADEPLKAYEPQEFARFAVMLAGAARNATRQAA